MTPHDRPRAWRIRTASLAAAALLGAAWLSGCASAPITQDGVLFYPGPPQRPRIQYLTKYFHARDIEGGSSSLMKFLVGDMSEGRQLRKPQASAAHDGVIYVADPGWGAVLTLDLKQRIFGVIGDRGGGLLATPVDIAVDSDGNKFVADVGRRQVVQFDAEDKFVGAFGNPNQLLPTSVAVDERFIYVVNREGHRVEVFDRRSRKRVRTFGEFGPHEAQFNRPTSIARDERGHLFVTDAVNFRIQEFDADGEYVQSYGFLGDGPGTFARPRGISVDREGHLYTVDAAFENVQIWDTSNAQVLLAFGGSGRRPGSMYLPANVHVDYDLVPYFEDFVDPDFVLEYVILVTNNYGPNLVEVFGFINPKDPSRYEEFSPPEEALE